MSIDKAEVPLMHGDCLELMQQIPDKSVDMVLCDLPYGLTRCSWDVALPLDKLWIQYKRIIKDHGAILLFGIQPFVTDLINSNRKMFRYEIIFEKTMPVGFLNANKMPLRKHEVITVFYKHLPTYNPQMWELKGAKGIGRTRTRSSSKIYGDCKPQEYTETGKRFPTDVINFSNWNGALFGKTENAVKHPTAKPVELLEYLIKTYTNLGWVVLDNCMGSGSTGVACVNLGRKFIGIEKEKDFFEIAKQRIMGD